MWMYVQGTLNEIGYEHYELGDTTSAKACFAMAMTASVGEHEHRKVAQENYVALSPQGN